MVLIEMAITVNCWKMLSYYVLCAIIIVTIQCTDDSEYNDFDFYEDLSKDYSTNYEAERIKNIVQDDYYVMNNFDDTENQQKMYLNSKKHFTPSINIESSEMVDPFSKEFNWYKLSNKVYRYTKHRIPGYDYDEFDYMRSKNFQQCDDKSTWTHCLCQFTCSEPNVVDCYTPCISGCECKEKYVFDEKTQRCLLPEHCSSVDNLKYKI